MERWPAPTMLVTRPAPSPASREPAVWFYLASNQERGPVAESQLRALIEASMLRASDLVWREGMPEWVEVRSVPGLLPRSLIKPPPTPAGPSVDDEREQSAPQVGIARTRNDEPTRSPDTQDCPFCASSIPARAKVCRECGETVDVALRAAEEAKREAKAANRRDRSSRQQVVIHRDDRRRFPHVLHLILTIFTAGLWFPVWIIHYVIWESS